MRSKITNNCHSDKINSEGFFNTLVRSWNKDSKVLAPDSLLSIKKRSAKKILTSKFVLPLIELHSPLEKQYRNTLYCNHTLITKDGKITGRYCGNAWCRECNGIRTAKLIKGYGPAVAEWNAPMYMVLTAKNVKGEELRGRILDMNEKFRKLTDLIRNRDGIYIQVIRTIEVTYNWKTKEYHPHFNVLVNGGVIGDLIIQEWLQYFPPEEADRSGQFITKMNGGTLNELFKYVTKLDKNTPAEALDTIFQAIRGINRVTATGVKKVSEELDDLVSVVMVPEIPSALREEWNWNADKKDWVSRSCTANPEGITLCSYIQLCRAGPN